jgi:hypothetical protein
MVIIEGEKARAKPLIMPAAPREGATKRPVRIHTRASQRRSRYR